VVKIEAKDIETTDIIVKTVLKSGGEYNANHVLRMRDMVLANSHLPRIRFVCYSDIDIPKIDVRPLQNNWKGWWSKIEMFRDINEESFYIDLDMTINKDISYMIKLDRDFVALRNMNPRIEGIGSALMKWKGDKSRIYRHFLACPEKYMNIYNHIGTNKHGDQSFIWDCMNGNIECFQDIFPNCVKKFNQVGGDITVYFGRNRPWKKA